MRKEVQMSIKMESELRDRFMSVAASTHRPAAQIVRELMRAFIARQELPNADTIKAIEAVERGEFTTYETTEELYKKLKI
jgi:predicted transcriptional regulator